MKAKKQAAAQLREKSLVENSMRQQLKAIRSLLISSSSPHYADLATAFNNVSAPRFHRFYGHFERLTGQYFGAPFPFIPYETSEAFLDRLCQQSLSTLIENDGRLKGMQGEPTPGAGRAWAEVKQVVDSKAGGGGIVGLLVQKRSAVDNRRGWSLALGCPAGAALAAALKPLCDALTEVWEDQVRRERDRSSPTGVAADAADPKLQLLSGATLSYFQASGSGPQPGPAAAAAAAAAVAVDPPNRTWPVPLVPLVIPPPRISAPGQLEGSAEAHRPVRARRPPTPPPQGSAAAEGPGPSPVARQVNRAFSLRIRIGSQLQTSTEPTDNNNSNKRKADKLPNPWSELETPQGPPQADGLKRAASVPGEWLRGALSDSLDFGLDTSKSHGCSVLSRERLNLDLQGFRDEPVNKTVAATGADANAALELGLPTVAASLRGISRESLSLIEPLVQGTAPAPPILPPPVFTGVDHFLASMGIDVGGRPSLHAATPGEGAGESAVEEENLLMDIDTNHDLGLFSNDALPTFSPRWDLWPGLKDMGSLGTFPADLADVAPGTARGQLSGGHHTKSWKTMPTPVPPPPGPTFAQMAEIPDAFSGDFAGK